MCYYTLYCKQRYLIIVGCKYKIMSVQEFGKKFGKGVKSNPYFPSWFKSNIKYIKSI